MPWTQFRSGLKHFSDTDLKRIGEAFALGMRAHEGQKRKSGELYFDHPVAVARMLSNMGADADTIIAALLHDTLEDTVLTLPDIERAFGRTVADLVDGVTKIMPADTVDRPSLNEQTETLRKIFLLMQKDVRIMIIKLIDRLHNMNTASFLSEDRRITLARETIDVYVKIADRLAMRAIRDELHALCLAILEPETHKQLVALRTENEGRGRSTMQKMQKMMHATHPDIADALVLHYEHKRWDKLREQAEIGSAAATGQAALVVVFVCADTDACYRTLGLLHRLWRRETMSFQDFINSPMINGYKGLHTTVILEDGTRVRCKIRTPAMHRYAETGVMNFCFTGEAKGLLDYLPWTQRISPLAASTENRSEEFWESLQSDVLGESIVLHCPTDETILVPRGSTALDGAFYCFQDAALSAKEIKINGHSVPFDALVENAVSIKMESAGKKTVERRWIEWVNTAYATAKIRSSLAQQSDKKKIATGRQLLQDMLQSRKKGFLEEFSPESMSDAILTLGLITMDDVFIAIADGRLEPTKAYAALFEKKSTKSHLTKKKRTTITYTLDPTNAALIARITQSQSKYQKDVEEIRSNFSQRRGGGTVTMTLLITPEEKQTLLAELAAIGVTVVPNKGSNSRFRFWTGIAVLVGLWGLDPVIGSMLIRAHELSAIDLSIVRFWSLTALSAGLLVWQHWHKEVTEVRLSIFNSSLWISALLLTAVSLTSYRALQTTDPSHYTIPMTAAGILLTSIVNRKHWRILIITWALLIGGTAILIVGDPPWSRTGVIFTLLAVVAFTMFSLISERYKRSEHIAARAAQYFFLLSLLCAIMITALAPLATLSMTTPEVFIKMIAFSIVFAGIPYYIYYYLLTYKQIDVVLRCSFLIIFATLAGQTLLWEIKPSGTTLFAGACVAFGAMLPMLRNFQRNLKS